MLRPASICLKSHFLNTRFDQNQHQAQTLTETGGRKMLTVTIEADGKLRLPLHITPVNQSGGGFGML